MFLRRLVLRDFRNIAAADIDFPGGRTFLLGRNAQGKTSVLEAAGLVTALRSFRGADTRTLVRAGAEAAVVRATLEREPGAPSSLALALRPGGRDVLLDGQPLGRLAELVGRFPTVALGSHDLDLVRDAPAVRRRFLDITLATGVPGYLDALQRYHRGLDGRNRLLRDGAPDADLAAFEAAMAGPAERVAAIRAAAVPEIAAALARLWGTFSADHGDAALALRANVPGDGPERWPEAWEKAREHDRAQHSTRLGPHRDDLVLSVRGLAAAAFASEGQQRGLVLALRLAQAVWLRGRTGTWPVVLADDVLGELDPERRARFWAALPEGVQVIATGTSVPDADRPWDILRVADGVVTPGGSA